MAVKEIIAFDSKLLDTTSVYDSTQAKKQSVINAEVLTALGAKINYTDALTLEEIEASTDLSNKVAAAAAVETIKESLSTKTEHIPVAVPRNGTASVYVPFPNGRRLFAVSHNSDGPLRGLYLLYDANTVMPIIIPSALTVTISNGTLTVVSTSSSTANGVVI